MYSRSRGMGSHENVLGEWNFHCLALFESARTRYLKYTCSWAIEIFGIAWEYSRQEVFAQVFTIFECASQWYTYVWKQ